jgi:hypothetical protein
MEERLEALFENKIPRLFGARLTSADLARAVAKAMEDGAMRAEGGRLIAPDTFLLELHPEDYILLLEREPDLPKLLAQSLLALAREVGYRLTHEPTVRFIPDLQVERDQVKVLTEHSGRGLDRTQSLSRNESASDREAETAFLELLGANRRYALRSARVTIGRRPENDIVLQDPHVSRAHARIRYQMGRYILTDLDSKAGLQVNGKMVQEHVLRPGDLIRIADNRFVFFIEVSGDREPRGADTVPLSDFDSPPAGE